MKWNNPTLDIKRKERGIHLAIWVVGVVLINIPEWNVTLGPFHSDDFSLIIPSAYGTLLNAYLFYSSALEIEIADVDSILYKIGNTLRLFLLITLIEATLDAIYFLIHYWHIDANVLFEIVLGQLLMNFIFFYLPSILYGFIRAWQRKDFIETSDTQIIIEDGPQKIFIDSDMLSHVESDRNYCIYHADRKYLVRKSLGQVQEELPSNFVRCHKSFIINSNLIKNLSYSNLILKGNVEIPIGRKFRENLMSSLNS